MARIFHISHEETFNRSTACLVSPPGQLTTRPGLLAALTDIGPRADPHFTSAVQAVATQDALRGYCLDDVWLSRMRLISRWGGAPNRRLYSRLNWEALS